MRRRLSLTIFLAVLGSLAVFAFAVSLAWWWNAQARDSAFEERLAGELAAEILPLADDGPEALRRALERWHGRARIDLTVLDQERRVVASAGRRLVDEVQVGVPSGTEGGPGASTGAGSGCSRSRCRMAGCSWHGPSAYGPGGGRSARSWRWAC
jgi:hypothetical protein